MENEIKKTEKGIDEKIRNRNNIFKIALFSFFSLLVGYKLIISDISFDFSKFDFSDLLSLILAVFSIGLAISFYFKATDTSNQFYDNTYKFTKDISGILGRIEAGFGEKLKHLDEGYTGLIDKFDGKGIKSKADEVEKVKKDLDTEKEKLEKEVNEKNQILEQLMRKAKLSDKEREEFSRKMNEKDSEINILNEELNKMKNHLRRTESIKDSEIIHSLPPKIIELLRTFIRIECDLNELIDAPTGYITDKLKTHKIERFISPMDAAALQKYGVLDKLRQFTPLGVELLRSIAKIYM